MELDAGGWIPAAGHPPVASPAREPIYSIGPYVCPWCTTHYESEAAREACERICTQPYDDHQDH